MHVPFIHNQPGEEDGTDEDDSVDKMNPLLLSSIRWVYVCIRMYNQPRMVAWMKMISFFHCFHSIEPSDEQNGRGKLGVWLLMTFLHFVFQKRSREKSIVEK